MSTLGPCILLRSDCVNSNFDSIRVAVREGRRLFLNIQRFILHLLTTNVAEVLLLIVGLCFIDDDGVSVFPLSPIAVLWVNMVRKLLHSRVALF